MVGVVVGGGGGGGILEDVLENAALSLTAGRHVARVGVVGAVDGVGVGVVSVAGVRSNCKICKPERE